MNLFQHRLPHLSGSKIAARLRPFAEKLWQELGETPEDFAKMSAAFWHWLTFDPRPPVQRFQIEYRTPAPRRLFWITRVLVNGVLISVASAAIVLMALAAIAVGDTIAGHPELREVVRRYTSSEIYQWEAAHGFGCVRWQHTREDGTSITGHGGPDCSADLPPRGPGVSGRARE